MNCTYIINSCSISAVFHYHKLSAVFGVHSDKMESFIRIRTANINKLDRVISKYERTINKTTGKLTRAAVKNMLKDAEEYFKVISCNYEEIIKNCGEEEIESHTELFNEIGDKYDDFRMAVEDFLLQEQVKAENKSSIHLPAQTLPKFSGDPHDWTSFSNTFNSMVGENENLTGIQRFRYLIGCLDGGAAKIISHIPESEDAFTAAWQLLLDRYQDKRFIILSELERLTSLQLKSDNLLEFVSMLNEIIRKLILLGEPVNSWDSILLHLISKKLPHNLVDEFENSLPDDSIPPFNEFIKFLEKRAKTAYKRELQNGTSSQVPTEASKPPNHAKCILCNHDHTLSKCGRFLRLDPVGKMNEVKKNKICQNCLRHPSKYRCTSTNTCQTCHKRHHTLLHNPNYNHGRENNLAAHMINSNSTILLATTRVVIENQKGKKIFARALLDTGAQSSLVTMDLAKRINNSLLTTNKRIKGVGEDKGRIPAGEIEIILQGIQGQTLNLRPLVYKTLTSLVPESPISVEGFTDLTLADPEYNIPAPIDMILGLDVYHDVMLPQVIHQPGNLTAQHSIFGWVISGKTSTETVETSVNHFTTFEENIKTFWELESVPNRIINSEEERLCEEIYTSTTRRTKFGRYEVRSPFKSNSTKLGQSKSIASQRLLSLERRFVKDPNYAVQYREILCDFIKQGHLKLVPINEINKPAVYVPHHGVKKEDSETTKQKFDASVKTNGVRV